MKKSRTEYYRRYREENREKLNAYHRKWTRENRDRVNEHKRRYRAKKKLSADLIRGKPEGLTPGGNRSGTMQGTSCG